MVHHHEVGLTFHFFLLNILSFYNVGSGEEVILLVIELFSLSPSLAPSQFRFFNQSFKSLKTKDPSIFNYTEYFNNPKLFLTKLAFRTKANFYMSKPQKQNNYCVCFSQLFL